MRPGVTGAAACATQSPRTQVPDIYSIHCEKCDSADTAESELEFGGFTVAVRRQPGHVFSPYRAVLNRSGEVVPLVHPLEQEILEREGFTWLGASIKGRLLEVKPLVCADCGTLVDRITVDFCSASGCLVIAILCGVLAVSMTEATWPIGIAVAWVAAIVQAFGLPKLFTVLYMHRVASLTSDTCVNCGCKSLLTAEKATGQRFVCRRCGQRTLVVRLVGSS